MRGSGRKPGGEDGDFLGKILDERYQLDDVLGEGAIGKVYAGTQLAVERKVAIKLLHPSIRERGLIKERFLREAKAVGRLSHSSCLTLFDFGSCEELGCFYMVTEYVEGHTLAEEMQAGALEPSRVFHILYQITAALQHAHERGILHRDLKPENIMLVGDDGQYPSVKVLDFGLARIREEAAQGDADEEAGSRDDDDDEGGARLTNFGELNGTPAYMSPEQCRGELNLTPACDFYGLGVLAFELLEGRLPFESISVHKMVAMHLHDPIPEMKSGRAPEAIEEMVYRMLAKSTKHRLQSPEEILDILRPFVSFEPSQEISMATLEGYKREPQQTPTPTADAPADRSGPVREPGAQTMMFFDRDTDADEADDADDLADLHARQTMHLDDAEASVSRDSTFGTLLAGEAEDMSDEPAEAAADDAEARRRSPLMLAGVALVVVLAGVGAWSILSAWDSAEPAGQAQASRNAEPSGQRTTPTSVREPAMAGAAAEEKSDVAVEAGADAGGDDSADAEALAEEAAPPPRPARPAAKRKPEQGSEPERRRPRKLELTY